MSLKTKLSYRVLYPFRYAVDQAVVRQRSKKPAVRVLIASDNVNATSEYQFAPLMADRALLRESGVVFDQKLIGDVLAGGPSAKYDAVLAKVGFLTPEADAIRMVTQLRARFPAAKLIYFDGDDDSCVQWPALLPVVDLYVKKHMFTDMSWYGRSFEGKNNLTDYVVREHGRSFAGNAIPHSGIVRDGVEKVALGWNIGLDDKITELFKTTQPASPVEKTVDVMCRAACAEENWIYPLRGPVNQALAPLMEQGYSVLLPDQRVDQKTYYDEMRQSRICVSPFGYGELCWRDFEAVLMGCLLVKPDMGHVRTEPDIFVPGETFVPVKWDFSDLSATCARYLADRQELERITRNAYVALSGYYTSHAAAHRFAALLKMAGLPMEISQ